MKLQFSLDIFQSDYLATSVRSTLASTTDTFHLFSFVRMYAPVDGLRDRDGEREIESERERERERELFSGILTLLFLDRPLVQMSGRSWLRL